MQHIPVNAVCSCSLDQTVAHELESSMKLNAKTNLMLGTALLTVASAALAEDLACFYEHANYQGNKLCVSERTAPVMPSGWNDRISSVMVNGSASVTLSEHIFGLGRSLVLTGSEANLVARGFNDKTSSYKVSRSGGGGGSGGTWVAPDVTMTYASPSDANTNGAQLFKRVMPDPVGRIKQLALNVAQTLYRNPADSSRATRVTLEIKSGDFVAYAGGGNGQRTVTISTKYIEDFYRQHGNSDSALATEIEGVMVHELTHVYQREPVGAGNYDGKSEFWAFIEGEADAVRTARGYTKDRNPKDTVNDPSKWLGGYNTTGFFLDYVARTYDKDFLYKFNDTARTINPWTFDKAMRATVGKGVSTLWDEYIRSLP
jgi:hypothetical protein